jgi:hypothetical protein
VFRDVSTTDHPDLSRLLADAAAIVAAASGDNLAAARAGLLVWMDAEEAAAYLNYPLAPSKRWPAAASSLATRGAPGIATSARSSTSGSCSADFR